jgi:predicted dehydrogenase
VAAVCDVDDKQAEGAAQDVAKRGAKPPRKVKDFREVMDMKEIDLVIVATPDHWHASPMILAAQAGKDVYCEKPCCHNIVEGPAMLDAAVKFKRVVQVGTHQRQIPHIQEAREFIRAGKLGKITQTNTYTYGNDTPDGMGNAPDGEVPGGVDYDMWLGPAPQRTFNPRRFHNTWRWYFDYASGMVGDWNVHLQDIIMWTMGVSAPISVTCLGGKWAIQDDRDTPDNMVAIYQFKEFTHTYTMRKTSGKPWDAGGYGMDFHGTNGMIHLTRNDWVTEPDKVDWRTGRKAGNPPSEWRIDWTKEQKNRHFPGADQLAHQAHVTDFLDCIRNRKAPLASIESHYNTVACCHLANVSLRVGRQIFWDGKKEHCFTDASLTTPDAEANRLLSREYRKGYELPKV